MSVKAGRRDREASATICPNPSIERGVRTASRPDRDPARADGRRSASSSRSPASRRRPRRRSSRLRIPSWRKTRTQPDHGRNAFVDRRADEREQARKRKIKPIATSSAGRSGMRRTLQERAGRPSESPATPLSSSRRCRSRSRSRAATVSSLTPLYFQTYRQYTTVAAANPTARTQSAVGASSTAIPASERSGSPLSSAIVARTRVDLSALDARRSPSIY